MKTKLIQTRIEADLLDNANIVLDEIGLSVTDIIRILLKQVAATGEVPLRLVSPKKIQTFTRQEKQELNKAIERVDSGETISFKDNQEMEKYFANL